ncbi:MAG: hypothetical protein COB53_07445 [Elusimicrobia bacterium]|nr:MAG: hypothetical protein COB53_07445 [Elusimicrobiota bacterium]
MPHQTALLALIVLLVPTGIRAESPLPHSRLDIEGLPNRYARRGIVIHRQRIAHRTKRLRHGLLSRPKKEEKIRKKARTPWDKEAPTQFEQTLVARLAQVFLDTIPAGGSKKWALRLKVILE